MPRATGRPTGRPALTVCSLCDGCRDIAENWDIDVAKELEDYLDELESVTITFDGGKTNLNFAEAALLIQVRTLEAVACAHGGTTL